MPQALQICLALGSSDEEGSSAPANAGPNEPLPILAGLLIDFPITLNWPQELLPPSYRPLLLMSSFLVIR
jgi:hypothetical protein